jgi:3-isopropylmalate dehydratase small subunit
MNHSAEIIGRCYAVGDSIDTDRIIAGKYTKSLDSSVFAEHLFEDLDPNFRHNFNKGDVVVAGWNFGCGSSREQAAVALRAAGVACVIARSFARIFFRNAINTGLPVLEIPGHSFEGGAAVSIYLENATVVDGLGNKFTAVPYSSEVLKIVQEGGLVAYIKKHGAFLP